MEWLHFYFDLCALISNRIGNWPPLIYLPANHVTAALNSIHFSVSDVGGGGGGGGGGVE